MQLHIFFTCFLKQLFFEPNVDVVNSLVGGVDGLAGEVGDGVVERSQELVELVRGRLLKGLQVAAGGLLETLEGLGSIVQVPAARLVQLLQGFRSVVAVTVGQEILNLFHCVGEV